MPAQNVPVLIGNTYKRDHMPGMIITKEEWIDVYGSPPREFNNPGGFPVGLTLTQMMTMFWKVKKWHLSGSGTRFQSRFDGDPDPPLVSWSIATDLIHSSTDGTSAVEYSKKTCLIKQVSDLRDIAASLPVDTGEFLYEWAQVDDDNNYTHSPFVFIGPLSGAFSDILHTNLDGQPAPIFLTHGSGSFSDFANACIIIYDEDSELFYPWFYLSLPGGRTEPIDYINTLPVCGALTITADGMDDISISFHASGTTANATMAATEYW